MKIKKGRLKGKKVIEFASSKIVDKYYDIQEEFICKVLVFWKDDPVFISDLSSLYDFTDDNNISLYSKRIKQIYNIDILKLKINIISDIIKEIVKLKS